MTGCFFAVFAIVWSDFSLDGGHQPALAGLQAWLLFLGCAVGGTAAGATLTATIAGVWAWFRIEPGKQGLALGAIKAVVALVLLLGFVGLLLAMIKPLAR